MTTILATSRLQAGVWRRKVAVFNALRYLKVTIIKTLTSFKHNARKLKMESRRRPWEEMDADCLVEIFMRLGVDDLTLAVPFVCRSWLAAALHPLCWRKLDFRRLDLLPWSNFSKSFTERYSLPFFSFTYLLKLAVERSCNSVTELRFPLKSTFMEDIVFTSDQCPSLKSVALPILSTSEEVLIPEILCKWKDLERLEMESKPSNFAEMVKGISLHCRQFRGLAVSSGSIREEDALAIISNLPKLKELKLSNSYLPKESLLLILNGCKELEELNVSGCIGFHGDDREIIDKIFHMEDFRIENCKPYYEYVYDSTDDEEKVWSEGYIL